MPVALRPRSIRSSSPSPPYTTYWPAANVAALPRPVGVEELAARLVHTLVGVGAEVIALRLQQVGGQPRAAVAIVERQRGGERRDGNAASTARATTRRQDVWQRSSTPQKY